MLIEFELADEVPKDGVSDGLALVRKALARPGHTMLYQCEQWIVFAGFYLFWITARPFEIPTMPLLSTNWNLSKNLQPGLSPGDGLTTVNSCSATSIGQSSASEERSRNFCYATVF